MASKETFEQIIKDCKDHKIVKPLDSVVDYDTTIGEYYEEEIEDIQKDLEDFEWLKSKLNLQFFDTLSNPEDKLRLLKIIGLEIEY